MLDEQWTIFKTQLVEFFPRANLNATQMRLWKQYVIREDIEAAISALNDLYANSRSLSPNFKAFRGYLDTHRSSQGQRQKSPVDVYRCRWLDFRVAFRMHPCVAGMTDLEIDAITTQLDFLKDVPFYGPVKAVGRWIGWQQKLAIARGDDWKLREDQEAYYREHVQPHLRREDEPPSMHTLLRLWVEDLNAVQIGD